MGSETVAQTKLPLEGYKVLDLTRARAGPTAVRVLADWGADVVQIAAPPKSGKKGGVTGNVDEPDYQNLHRNKRSMTLNLAEPEGHEVFMQLAEKADVIVENYRADVKHRLGIDYDAVAKRNPRIVFGSISGFGQTGPYRDRPGVDQIAQGMGGLMSITGLPGQGPVRVGIPITDLCAGMFLAQGIFLALFDREKTGKGQWVHTSLLEVMTFMLDFQAARWLQKGEVPIQVGNDHPTAIPQGCFRTADQNINIGASGDLYPRLCAALDANHLVDDPKYDTFRKRSENRDQLHGEIEAILTTKPAAHWIEALNNAGVPCGPVNTIDQVFADPQVRHLGVVHYFDHPRLGHKDVVRQPVTLSNTQQPEKCRYASPDPGEHTSQILTEFGFDDAAIARMRDNGTV
jgi:crotonobetainyl-CoA:carnitine CoA-transferase CaiB-like acyl-CoA transferase